MKKTILSALAIAALTLTVTSCGPSKAYTANKAAMETVIANAQTATTPEEFAAISEAYKVASDSIVKAFGTEMSADEKKTIDSLGTKLVEISYAKSEEFAAAATAKAEEEALALKALEEEEAAKKTKK